MPVEVSRRAFIKERSRFRDIRFGGVSSFLIFDQRCRDYSCSEHPAPLHFLDISNVGVAALNQKEIDQRSCHQ
jgi:hypothetical protein